LFNLFWKKKFPEKIDKILVIELDNIGDIIVTTPTIRTLSQYFNIKIDVMVKPNMVDVLSGNPNINKILPYGLKEIDKNYNKILLEIKDKYDLGVILHHGTKKVSKLLLDANVNYRIGCTRPNIRMGKGFFLHKKTKPSFRLKHKIEDNLDTVRIIGVNLDDRYPELYSDKKSDKFIEDLLKKNGVKEKDLLVIIHAAPQYYTHKWVNKRFAEVADFLVDDYNAKIIFSGEYKDIELNNEIISLMKNGALNFAGKTKLKEFFALIKMSDLVISVDTSAMHIASAFDLPVIALFGAGNPIIWRPYCDNCRVLYKKDSECVSCMKHICDKNLECMKVIQVDDVINAIKEILDR